MMNHQKDNLSNTRDITQQFFITHYHYMTQLLCNTCILWRHVTSARRLEL